MLVYTDKITSRIEYAFKFIFTSILGIEIELTSKPVKYIDERGPKIVYMKYPLKSGLFFEAHPLLFERGVKENPTLELELVNGTPYFFKTSAACTIGFDIFAASFYLISRYEEYLPYIPDVHERFPVKKSLAYMENFIHKPIVDIWARKLLEILKKNFPDLSLAQRSFKLINTFSISRVWTYRGIGFTRNLAGGIQDLLLSNYKGFSRRMDTILRNRPDPLDTYNDIIEYHKKYCLHTILFFLVGHYDMYDKNASIYNDDFRNLIKSMSDDVKVGLCTSYASVNKPYLLSEEKKHIEDIIYRPVSQSFQHFTRLRLPDTYRNLIESGIREDYSMGFHNCIGFRAGTCTPFLFYDLKNEALTPLKIFPLSASVSAFRPSRLSSGKIKEGLLNLMQTIKEVQGTYILMMSNEALTRKDLREAYEALLEGAAST